MRYLKQPKLRNFLFHMLAADDANALAPACETMAFLERPDEARTFAEVPHALDLIFESIDGAPSDATKIAKACTGCHEVRLLTNNFCASCRTILDDAPHAAEQADD